MTNLARILVPFCAIGAILAGAQGAWAHPGHGLPHAHPWASGMLHPLLGLDHLLAILLASLLAVRLDRRQATWAIPLVFIALMLAGTALANFGSLLPLATWSVALAAVTLCFLLLALPNPRLDLAIASIGLFAICHGHTHAAQGNVALLPFMSGLIVTTAVLLSVCIGVAAVARRWDRPALVRIVGVGVALACVLSLIAR